ncbi:MAG: hypothetical protein ACRDST_02000 [Pseudonocardiaceae bacterium]
MTRTAPAVAAWSVYLSGKTRVRQETADPQRALGVGEDPIEDVPLLIDVKLPTLGHLDGRRRPPATLVLARKRDPQPCWIFH